MRQKCLEAALDKTVKDKEECNQQLQVAREALINYKGNDENLRLLTTSRRPMSP